MALKVVLDSNVLISALAFGGKPWLIVRAGFLGKYQLQTSHFISEEVKRVLVELGHSNEEAETALEAYEWAADLIFLEEVDPVSRDKDDDPILATAKTGGADYLVTGDQDLLVIEKYEGAKILAPANFLEEAGVSIISQAKQEE